MNTKEIKLSGGYKTIVDSNDYYYLMGLGNWFYNNGYAAMITSAKGGKKREVVYMHRLINCTPKDLFASHINGDSLDNRRENLKNVTRQDYLRTRAVQKNSKSGIKGVCYRPRDKAWIGYIKTGEQLIQKYFKEKDDAIAFRKEMESIYFK